jgi:hypothetical protein
MQNKEHNVGDLLIRYYFQANILGYVKRINDRKDFMFVIEWINPPDGLLESYYDIQELSGGKRRLDEYQRTQTR